MTERIVRLRNYISAGKQKEHISAYDYDVSKWRNTDSTELRTSYRFAAMLEAQQPVFFPDSDFIPCRTTCAAPDILSDEEYAAVLEAHTVHERGYVTNICPDYAEVIACGCGAVLEKAEKAVRTAAGKEKDFLKAGIISLSAFMSFAGRCRDAARIAGREDIAGVLDRIPEKGAQTFREALQFFRLLHFALWCEGEYHNIVGRLDQIMLPYYSGDIASGVLTADRAFEMLCDFFLSFNVDSPLYPGMQQGDNGQSVMLGGRSEDGTDMYNELSELMLRASLELKMIDPKINLRVDRKTPSERYELASKLTAVGIGFPQYSNDDVIIPGLVRLGYTPADAADYVAAACWEIIIPAVGADIPNIDALSFLLCVDRAVRKVLAQKGSFDTLLTQAGNEIRAEADRITSSHNALFCRPAPFLSFICRGCIENGRDISEGLKYNNYGIHGTGIAPAADYLSAVNELVYQRGELSGSEFIHMLDCDFRGFDKERSEIINNIKRMGNNTSADDYAGYLINAFSSALEGKRNERGGVWRAGTASAMYYVTHAAQIGATGDGRHKGDYLPANFSPSLLTKLSGPFSVITSFTKADLGNAVNGGPLTLEFSPSSVNGRDGTVKLAALVKSFICLGGHQLQLNVIDAKALADAQLHPEKHRDLIVRVWGWSGYFTELDREYQDQIIKRSVLNI